MWKFRKAVSPEVPACMGKSASIEQENDIFNTVEYHIARAERSLRNALLLYQIIIILLGFIMYAIVLEGGR